jgi:hypothetical protein
MPRCLELIHQTVKPLRRLINLKGPTGLGLDHTLRLQIDG